MNTWNRPGALGDVLLTLNLAKNFKAKYPGKLFYKCHPSIFPVIGTTILQMGFDGIIDSTQNHSEGHEFKLIGFPIHEGYPEKPMKKHLIEYFADELKIEPDFDSFDLDKPKFPYPKDFVTVHAKAGWSQYKNWSIEKIERLCLKLKDKIDVIQIGGDGDPHLKGATARVKCDDGPYKSCDLFRMSLSAMANAKLHIGPDSWTNHATNIKFGGQRTKGIILWGSTQVLASGYKTNVNISKDLPCQPCFVEDPKISSMPNGDCRNPIKQKCMQDISVDEVYEAVMENL
jgi:ADP-heptose:LPS heptosyltransferase